MMLKLKFQYFGYLMGKVNSLEKIIMLGGVGGGMLGGDDREWGGGMLGGDDREWDGWMASPTRQTGFD